MASILDILEFATGFIGIEEQNKFDEEARQDILERRETQRGMSTGLRGRVLPGIAKLGREQMGMLEGSGVQQKKDVRRRFGERQDAAMSNLNRRGLGNTTIGASISKGFGEFEEDALARVDEQVRQERMSTHGYWGLLGQTMDVDLTGQQINIEAGGAIPAQQSPWLARSELLARFQPPPEAPEAPGTDTSGLLLQGAIGAGTSLLPMAFGLPPLPPGGFIPSDPGLKMGILGIDHSDILNRVERLEVKEWEYDPEKVGAAWAKDNVGKHIGPMADQFKEIFGLGDSDKTINMIDAFGVCLSAIKALSARVRELESLVQPERRTDATVDSSTRTG